MKLDPLGTAVGTIAGSTITIGSFRPHGWSPLNHQEDGCGQAVVGRDKAKRGRWGGLSHEPRRLRTPYDVAPMWAVALVLEALVVPAA